MFVNQFGPNGNIKIGRVSDGKVLVTAQEIHFTGSISAKKIFMDGLSVLDYFKGYIDAKVADALEKKLSKTAGSA